MKMIKTILMLLVILIFATGIKAGEKSELKWRKFDTGVAEAKKAKKKILIDVYTDWCKWCKKLDAEVYTDAKIVEYVNKNYIPIKVNGESKEKLIYKGESMTEAGLTQSFGITGFPTILFLESNGDAINKLGSFVPADQFLKIIQYIGGDHYKKISFDEFLQNKDAHPKINP
jgi:thioredoxin-related protein